MRIKSLALTRYGNYDDSVIHFDDSPGVVNILWAPNGAGKSVLRNAVTDLLYGIHNQTPMGFRYEYKDMRLTADVVRSDGTQHLFSRRKTRGNVISGGDGAPLDQAFLHGILGGRDRALLERLFVLDTESLRAGGAALLESGGDVGSALLAAAGGIREARALKQRLEQQRDEIAPARTTASRRFYQARERFQDASKQARSDSLRPDEWHRQQRELEKHEAEREKQNQAADAASIEIARLERIRRVRPWLAQLDEANTWLDRHPTSVRLSAGLRQVLDTARLEYATREATERRTRETLERAEQSADDVLVDDMLLARAEEIEALVHEAGAARKARDDLPGVRVQYEHRLSRIRELLRQLGTDLPPEQAHQLLPARPLLARTQQRIKEHTELSVSLHSAPSVITARENELRALDLELTTLPAARDVLALETIAAAIRSGGEPAKILSDTRQAQLTAEGALAAALAHVPGWTSGPEALMALRPPMIDQWHRLNDDLVRTGGEESLARDRLSDETASLEQVRLDLAAMSRDGTIPDIDALSAARSHRDMGWRLIFRRTFGGDPPTPGEERSFAGDTPLPLAFERAMTEADMIADRRAQESGRLGRIEAAREAIVEAERRVTAATARARIAEERHARIREVWRRLSAVLLPGENLTFSDIQTFLNTRDRVIELLERCNQARGSVARVEREQNEWRARLASALGHEGNLTDLLVLAEQTLARARRDQNTRTAIETKRARAAKEVADAASVLVTVEQKLNAWRARWQSVLIDLNRKANEEPIETEAVLQIFQETAKEHQAAIALAERIAGMTAELERFRTAVNAISEGNGDPFASALLLERQLTQERARNERRRVLAEARAKARADWQIASESLAAADTKLRAVLDLIGTADIEDAASRLALSDERTRYETMRDDAETKLRTAGDGLKASLLREEAAGHSPVEDVARIEAAAFQRKEASDAAQRAAEAASTMRQDMERRVADTSANAAAADQQAAIASMSSALDEALVYHAASLMLGKALDALGKSGDSAMLARLGDIFQMLTCGEYSHAATEIDDSGKASFALVQRDFPNEPQSIRQLSEGTRDQFFLALRAAAIEDHLKSAESLPFIGDDILQTFDDQRSLATLRMLTDLSYHTQIIILTHHRHLLDLAASLPKGSTFLCEAQSGGTIRIYE